MSTDQKDDGGSAFPLLVSDYPLKNGMSLRDYFAGQALAGMFGDATRSGEFEAYARDAYRAADAMIAERRKGKS